MEHNLSLYLSSIFHELERFYKSQSKSFISDNDTLIKSYLSEIDYNELKRGHKNVLLTEAWNMALNYAEPSQKFGPLKSIFSKFGQGNDIKPYCFNVRELDLDLELTLPSSYSAITGTELATVCKVFNDDFKSLFKINIDNQSFAKTLHFLVKKHFSRVANESDQFTSYYDHIKLYSALVKSLEIYELELENPEKYEFQLLCLDLSGIQAFIYNITNKKASISLKGRSFYLGMYLQGIIDLIIENCHLTDSNLLYSSGGKAFIILPNTVKIDVALDNIEVEVQNSLWKYFNLKLYCNFGVTKFSINKTDSIIFEQDNSIKTKSNGNPINKTTKRNTQLQGLIKSTLDEASKSKGKRFYKILDYTDFNPSSIKGNITNCVVTGEILDTHHTYKGEIEPITELVKNQFHFGSQLKKANYIIKSKDQTDSKIEILGLNKFVEVKEQLPRQKLTNNQIVLINNTDLVKHSEDLIQGNSLAFQFYGGNDNKETFEQLVNVQDSEIKKLGVLRMDVDNLGKLFIELYQLPVNISLSLLSTLSNSLDFFFSGLINKLTNDNIQIIYSGGDDIFAVGGWQQIVEFAESIKNKFSNFICNNPIVTISAGVVLVDANHPIASSASLAGQAEHLAKNHKIGSLHKNSITLLEVPLNWDYEYPFVKCVKNVLVEAINVNKWNKSLLHNIMTLDQMSKIDKVKWIWVGTYYFNRAKEQSSNSNKIDSTYMLIGDINFDTFTSSIIGNCVAKSINTTNTNYNSTIAKLKSEASKYSILNLCAIAARWAELELKKNNNK